MNVSPVITFFEGEKRFVATNYSASEYPPFRGFLNVGDIHSCEPWLYSECLAKNISVRARAWREKQTSVGIRLSSR